MGTKLKFALVSAIFYCLSLTLTALFRGIVSQLSGGCLDLWHG